MRERRRSMRTAGKVAAVPVEVALACAMAFEAVVFWQAGESAEGGGRFRRPAPFARGIEPPALCNGKVAGPWRFEQFAPVARSAALAQRTMGVWRTV